MAAEQAQDLYDKRHYGAARTSGQIVGTAGQLALMAPVSGANLAGRIAQATPLIAREVAALGGAGGALGVVGQAVSDVNRKKVSSFRDYAGAAVGGAVGALAARRGSAAFAGATAGAATSLAQDIANQRPVSGDRLSDSVITGGAFGAAGGVIGRAGFNRLDRKAKEEIGEAISRLRTGARWQSTLPGGKKAEYLKEGGWTFPDSRTSAGTLVESKAGQFAKLSKRQQQAYDQSLTQPDFDYRVDHVTPYDAGRLTGLVMAERGYLNRDELDRLRRRGFE
jgi:hypothetical protein